MTLKRPHAWRYRAPIERRRVPDLPMSKKPWTPQGERPAGVRVFTPEERQQWEAANPAPPVTSPKRRS